MPYIPQPSHPMACSPLQAAALRALGCLAVLSEPLCRWAVLQAERCLSAPAGNTHDGGCAGLAPGMEVQLEAVALLADSIDAFPSAFSGKLQLLGRLMTPAAMPHSGRGDAPQGEPSAAACAAEAEQLALETASAYCRLLLRNKLRLQDAGMLAPVGCALAGGSGRVAAVARHALSQLLLAAPPKGRARLCLDLFHQTPLERGWRQLLAEVRAAGLGCQAGSLAEVCVCLMAGQQMLHIAPCPPFAVATKPPSCHPPGMSIGAGAGSACCRPAVRCGPAQRCSVQPGSPGAAGRRRHCRQH